MTNVDAKNKCGLREELMAYLYSEASSTERRTVETHLQGCPACREELTAFANVRQALQEWQVGEAPAVGLRLQPARRSALTVLRELFTVMPLWTRAVAATAMLLLTLSVFGTDVSIGRNGFSFHTDLLRSGTRSAGSLATEVSTPDAARLAELRLVVNELIGDSARQQNEKFNLQLVALENQLQTMRSDELARLAARIQEQRARLTILERDVDRREGMDLSDILFGDPTRTSTRPIEKSGD